MWRVSVPPPVRFHLPATGLLEPFRLSSPFIKRSLVFLARMPLAARPEDVEDYGVASVTFSDGTKALCIASDAVLGGTKNYIEI